MGCFFLSIYLLRHCHNGVVNEYLLIMMTKRLSWQITPADVGHMLLNINVTRVGSEEQYDPRTAEDILNGFYPNTEPCINLKILSLEPGRMDIGAIIHGILTRDGDDHYTFLEDGDQKNVSPTQRNPHVYRGRFVNVNQSSDGTMYPTFNRPRYSKVFTFHDFCREAAAELQMVAGLVGKKGSKK